jgi:predicted MFS family arabinose efflux permease
MRVAGLEVPALCIGNALGSCTPGVQSVWVAWFIKQGSLTPSEIGWLGSSEQFLIAISALIVSACWHHADRRLLPVAAASLVAVANAVAMFPAIQTLIVGRLLSGVGTGVLLACMIGAAARRKGAQRVLALMQGTVVLLMSTVYFVSPILVGRYGPAGLFGFIAGIGVAGAVALLVGLPDLAPAATKVTGVAGTSGVAPMLGCLALTSIVIGVNTVSVYMFTVGNRLGFGPRTMGNVLAAVGPLAMLGPVAAHILGERLGLLRPLLFGLAVIASNFFFVVSAASPFLLCIHAAVQSMALLFCMTYAIALVSRVDASGRFVSALPAFIMIGSAVGPKLGSELIGFAQFRALAAVAASCVTVGFLLFVALDQATSKASRINLHGVLP